MARSFWIIAAFSLLVACGGGTKEPLMGVDGTLPGTDGSESPDLAPADVPDIVPADADDATTDAVTPDAGPDVTEPDATEPPPPCAPYPEGWLDALCTEFCTALETFDLNDLFAPPESCHAECIDVLTWHPEWLSNFFCVTKMEEHYFFGNCWWPKPLDPIPACTDWCAEVAACNLWDVFQVPEEPCLCEAACTGFFTMTGEAANDLATCAAGALAEQCDVFTMMDCFGGAPDCEERCAELYSECPEGEGLSELFPQEEDCFEFCAGATQQQLFATQVCVGITECAGAIHCDEAGDEPAAGCEAYCAAFNDLCPDQLFPESLCPWACTGALLGLAGSDAQQGLACLAETDVCPTQPEFLFVGCLANQCTSLCHGDSLDCPPGSPYFDLYPTIDACEEACAEFTPFQAQVETFCHLLAGCEGGGLCGQPPEDVAPGCESYCDDLTALCPALNWYGSSCEALCTAATLAWPGVDPGTAGPCLAQFDTCPEDPNDALFGCIQGQCGGICGRFDECEPDSDYLQTLESPGACQELCSTFTYPEAVAATWCIGWAGCNQTAECLAVPPEPLADCDIYCAVANDLCPDAGIPQGELCPWACTGLTQAIPVADPAQAESCYETYDTCPDQAGKVIYGCLVPTTETCVDVCSALHACDLTLDWVCEIFCAQLAEENPAAYDYFTQCVTNAETCVGMQPCVGQ